MRRPIAPTRRSTITLLVSSHSRRCPSSEHHSVSYSAYLSRTTQPLSVWLSSITSFLPSRNLRSYSIDCCNTRRKRLIQIFDQARITNATNRRFLEFDVLQPRITHPRPQDLPGGVDGERRQFVSESFPTKQLKNCSQIS